MRRLMMKLLGRILKEDGETKDEEVEVPSGCKNRCQKNRECMSISLDDDYLSHELEQAEVEEEDQDAEEEVPVIGHDECAVSIIC